MWNPIAAIWPSATWPSTRLREITAFSGLSSMANCHSGCCSEAAKCATVSHSSISDLPLLSMW